MALKIEDCQHYLGLPWRRAGFGPDAYDCWGLVLECLSRDGHTVDVVINYDFPGGLPQEFSNGILNPHWQQKPAPVDGGIVYCLRAGIPVHIGYIVEGMVLHAVGEEGSPGTVQLSPIGALKRLYSELRFYTWHES